MNQLPRHLFAKPRKKSVCHDAAKIIIEPKLDNTQRDFRRGRSTIELISTLRKFSRNPGSMPKTFTDVLSTSVKSFVKCFGGCCGSPVLLGASCRPPNRCIPAQKVASVSGELNHDRSALVSTQTMVCAVLIVCIRVLHTTVRGPNPTCETIFPGRKTHSADNEKILYLQKMC